MRPDLRIVASNVSPMTVEQGVAHYLAHIAARGLSANTVRAYGSDLVHYVRFVARLGHGELVAVQSARTVSRFLDDQSAQGMSLRTQARRLSAVRGFFVHARREGWTGFDPTADEHVKFRKPRVVAPELDALHATIDQIPRTGTLNLRDRAILRLMLDSGLRISALTDLDLPGCGSQAEVDLKRRLVHYVGKGGDTRSKPFNDTTLRVLEEWLAVRGDLAAPGCVALFVSGRGVRPCRQTVHNIIVGRGKAAGLRLHAHLIRHRRGAHVIETCGDKVAQQFLDHASLATTSDYGSHADNVTAGLLRQRADIDAGREQGRACA